MAEDIESGGEASKSSDAGLPNAETSNDLPATESPPLSPAGEDRVEILHSALVPFTPASGRDARSAPPRFRLRPRHKRHAVLAASVAIAAAVGVVAGVLATRQAQAPRTETASLRQQQAIQQSLGRLNQDVAALKANLEAGSKTARSQIAKITERLNISAPETTGSIPVPPATVAVPTPLPRPAVRTAAADNHVIEDWWIHDVRDGYVYVKGHGEIYQVVPGAPLPGLGPVQEIKRRDGRWVVVTPKGLIVSSAGQHPFNRF